MEKQKSPKKFLDKFILFLIFTCMVLVVTHQVNNLLDMSVSPVETPTARATSRNKFIIDVETRDEDILEDWFTPTPSP